MSLPIVPLATGSVVIGSETVTFRSLSRSEVVTLPSLADDPGAAEVFIISHATGSTDEEAQAWREAVDAKTAAILLDAIAVLSGIRQAGKRPNP